LNLLAARVEAGPGKRSFRRRSPTKASGKTGGKAAAKSAKKPAGKKK
jgi:hypothetical protein